VVQVELTPESESDVEIRRLEEGNLQRRTGQVSNPLRERELKIKEVLRENPSLDL
jgi:hypothetical protein